MELEQLIQLLLAFGVGGIIVEILRSIFHRKKMGADYADVIASSAIKLLQPLEDRIQELEQELLEAKNELRKTKRELHQARNEVSEARREIRDLAQAARNVGRDNG